MTTQTTPRARIRHRTATRGRRCSRSPSSPSRCSSRHAPWTPRSETTAGRPRGTNGEGEVDPMGLRARQQRRARARGVLPSRELPVGDLAMLQVKSPSRTLELPRTARRVASDSRHPTQRGARHVFGPRDVAVSGARGSTRVPLRLQDWPRACTRGLAAHRADRLRAVRPAAVGRPSTASRSSCRRNTWQAYNRRDADRDG